MVNSKTRVGGGFRTLTGAQAFLAIHGYIGSVALSGAKIEADLSSEVVDPA